MRKQVSTIKTLMKYLGARKYWILVSLVLALGSVGLSLYIPVLTGQAVDLALGRGTVDMAGIGGILLKIGLYNKSRGVGKKDRQSKSDQVK